MKCSNCGYVYADLALSDEEFFALYSEKYFHGEEYRDYLSEKRIIQKNFKLRFDELRPFIDPQRHRRIFEIGSAYGFFLDLIAKDFEWAGGIDVTDDGPRHASQELGLNVSQGDFLDYEPPVEKLDVVCMWDTIEHLRSPHLYLEKASEWMDSGGLVAITTGDIESYPARLRGSKWRLIHPPTHAHYFSKETMAKMLENYGFEVVYHKYCGFYRSIETIAYVILVLRKDKPATFERLRSLGLLKNDIYLNFYDIMYTIARKV